MKAVILAGGGGTRLWPLSTPERPKQFQKIISDKTMLEESLDLISFLKPKDIYIAINEKHIDLVRELAPKIPEKNIIIEPTLRDTASCIGLAATIIAKRHPKEVMAVIYADYIIRNKKELQKKLKIAEKLALSAHTLNIIEVPATEPSTNYGYVKLGKLIKKINNTKIYELDSFVEKPNLSTAKKFIKSKKYLWNTGLYVWEAKTLLEHYKKIQPNTYKKLQKISSAYDTAKQNKVLFSIYPTLEKISIDYAIMEKVDPKKVRIIEADLDWSDIGSFETIWKEFAKNKNTNIKNGKIDILDCNGCLIHGDKNKKIKAIGLKDIIIIDTPDGLLVCKRGESKKIKLIDHS